jgi:hypothetical protein
MDYYYALLESYDQLKRRKFKLSLREQEKGPDLGAAAADAAKVLGDLRSTGEGQKKDGLGVGKNLTATVTKGAGIEVKGVGGWPLKFNGQQVAAIRNSWQKENSKANKLVVAWAGGKPERPSTGQDRAGQPIGAAEGPSLPDQTPQDRAMRAAEQLDERLEGLESKLKEYGYEPTAQEKLNRAKKAGELATKAAAGETERGEGVHERSAAYGDTSITDKVISNLDIPNEHVEDALAAATRLIDVSSRIGTTNPPTISELRELRSQLKVTKHGVMFGDGKDAIYITYKSKAVVKNDPMVAMAERVNSAIIENNEKLKKLDKNSQEYKDGYIDPLKSKNKGSSLSKRGPILEAANVMTVLGNTLVECQDRGGDCSRIEEKIKEQFAQMKGDGSIGQAQDILRTGMCANADACLVSLSGEEDAVIVREQVKKFLTDDPDGPQLDDRQADELIRLAGEYDDGGARAMAMLVASSRGFTGWMDGIVVTDATQWGGADATAKGQKDDLRYTMSREDFELLKERMMENQTQLEKKLEKAANCGGAGVGMDQWGTDAFELNEAKKAKKKAPTIRKEEGDVVVPSELKCVEDDTSRIKAGEGNTKKLTEACDPEEEGEEVEESLEEKFLKANTQRLENCAGDIDYGKGEDGKPRTAEQAACDFQRGVNESPTIKAFSFLTTGANVDDEGNPLPHTGAGLVSLWETNKAPTNAKDQKKMEERAEHAKKGFSAMQDNGKAFSELPPEQREAITKIGLELQQAEIAKRLDKDTDSDGNVTGEGAGYLLTRMTQDSGSLNECGKEVRMLGEGTQGGSLINVTVYGGVSLLNKKQARLVRKPGSNTYTLETNEGETIMKGSMERGQNVNEVGSDTINPVETRQQRNAREHAPTAEEIMQSFLVGQKELLETLLNQTT